MPGISDEDIARISATGPQFDPMDDGHEVVHGKHVTRPMVSLRKKPQIFDLVEQGKGYLTDYSGNHDVTLEWHLNEASDRDKIFKLVVDGKECYIDLEELLVYTRVMFQTRRK